MAGSGMAILAIFAGLVVWGLVRMTRSLANPGPRLVRFVDIACLVVIVFTVIGAGLTIAGSLSGDYTTVSVPLVVRTPDVIVPGVVVDKPPATILSGGVDQATLVLRGLSWQARLPLAAGTAIQAAVIVLIAWTMRRLARNLRSGQPFTDLSRPLFRVAAILFVGTLLYALVNAIGSDLAGQEALAIQGWGSDETSPWPKTGVTRDQLSYLGWPEPATFRIMFPWTPFAVALGLAVLGLAFRAGERMQTDTAGLV
ncbi:MAG: hypothetical protein QM619_06180 [Micropruina sp.]|uniref:hypothetical protein n=1 Tax=Micropruina sp. TaxID=2737536 RepID=UPI0039E64A67